MVTEIHKQVCNAIWRGLRDLEILDELRDPRGLNLNLNGADERAMEDQISRLRNEIKEARELAPAFAEQRFREGDSWKQVVEALSRPYLLSSVDVIAVASRAQDAVKAEAGV